MENAPSDQGILVDHLLIRCFSLPVRFEQYSVKQRIPSPNFECKIMNNFSLLFLTFVLVLKRTLSLRLSFEHPKHMFLLRNKEKASFINESL